MGQMRVQDRLCEFTESRRAVSSNAEGARLAATNDDIETVDCAPAGALLSAEAIAEAVLARLTDLRVLPAQSLR